MPMKTHYQHGPHGNACGRASSNSTTNVYRVDCLACQKSDQFLAAKQTADAAKQAAFEAQTPREYHEPWSDGVITCRGKVEGSEWALMQCGNTLFRQADRSCYGHYFNYVCAKCGHVESRLTETGMSF